MPYINPLRRETMEHDINALFHHIETKGDLNYCITKLVHLWVLELVARAGKRSYDLLSLGKSVLQDAKDEYGRKVLDPYENQKAHDNGYISDLDGDMQVPPL